MRISLPSVKGVKFALLARRTGFAIGDDGSVWSLWVPAGGIERGWKVGEEWRRLNPTRTSKNEFIVSLANTGIAGRRGYVHRLVLEAFVGPCPEGMECCHWDGDRTNNRLSNLRWDTPTANAADRERHGRKTQGERQHLAKLDERRVREIREKHATGHRTFRSLATEYGVAPNSIALVVKRLTWKHVP